MAFSASGVSGRERKKGGRGSAVQGGAPLLDGQQAAALGQPWRVAYTRRQNSEADRPRAQLHFKLKNDSVPLQPTESAPFSFL
jgi:hypothetical protein